MNTEKLDRFLIGFRTEVLPLLTKDNTGLVYEISQSLAEDELVKTAAHLKTGSGYSSGEFMGVQVKTFQDFRVNDYRDLT